MHVEYLIIGAGPTGLGAAWELFCCGKRDFLVLERYPEVGGLSGSFKDPAGFTWDIGGHVLFSHYDYFDRLLDSLLGAEYLEHQRIARIRLLDSWVPYPFQNNLRYLPKQEQWECVQGLLHAAGKTVAPDHFADWIQAAFGNGIARLFMFPYNHKVWAHPLENMAFSWIGERVSIIDVERVLRSIILEQDDTGWGPNNVFRFPLSGGTGEIWRRLGARFADHIRTETEMVFLNPQQKTARLSDGDTITYAQLLNTGPLDRLVTDIIADVPDDIRLAGESLQHSSVFVSGVGVDSRREDPTCWMYFPENNCPFYRLTNFHNYSPNNAGTPGSRALMAETAFSAHKPEDVAGLTNTTVQGLVNTSMIQESDTDALLTTFEYTAEYGYPVPTKDRDAALQRIQPYLESLDIFSRGRFGGWKYEVGNMDHSLMQGVEWARRMLSHETEITYKV